MFAQSFAHTQVASYAPHVPPLPAPAARVEGLERSRNTAEVQGPAPFERTDPSPLPEAAFEPVATGRVPQNYNVPGASTPTGAQGSAVASCEGIVYAPSSALVGVGSGPATPKDTAVTTGTEALDAPPSELSVATPPQAETEVPFDGSYCQPRLESQSHPFNLSAIC